MPRYLVLSDIHSNWEALQACMAAVQGLYDQVVCCGDLVGYGADPNLSVEWVREHCRFVVRGNHDKAGCGLTDAREFNVAAKTAAFWTREQLTPENLEYLRNLPTGPMVVPAPDKDFHIVHGSFRDEDEYMLSASDAADEFEHVQMKVTFFGHTHVQGGFAAEDDMIHTPKPNYGSDISTRLLEIEERERYLLNPGSIGQPRDGDSRAALTIYDPETCKVEYWRIPYDVAAAQEKINAAGPPPILATRLGLGR